MILPGSRTPPRSHCRPGSVASVVFHLLRVGLLGRQRAGLFVQGVDDGPVAADLLGHVLVFLHQRLSGELVVADVHAGDDPQHVQHPCVDVVGIGLRGGNKKFYTSFLIVAVTVNFLFWL